MTNIDIISPDNNLTDQQKNGVNYDFYVPVPS